MKRMTGIGGIFFQSESPEHLYDWYEKHLGIKREPHGQGATFEWRGLQTPDGRVQRGRRLGQSFREARSILGRAKPASW
jgi:hypothetical protein